LKLTYPRFQDNRQAVVRKKPGWFRFSFCPVCANNQGFMNGVVTPASRTTRSEKSFELAIFAAMIAGACTFLNVYCTQPLLPFFQRLFHAS
jgi:hypothetical protein